VRNDLPSPPLPDQPSAVGVEFRSLYQSVRSLKILFDILLGRVGDPIDRVVTWQELVDAGVITEEAARAIVATRV
jgi:hypothetical protein